MTNFDKLKSMDINNLAEFIAENKCPPRVCPKRLNAPIGFLCRDCWCEYLSREIEADK